MSKCESCPVSFALSCLGEMHRPVCFQLSDPGRRDQLVALAEGRAVEAVTIDPIALAVELCDFRRSSCGCLGKPATCLQAGYPAVVMLADCRSCLSPLD